MSVTMSQAIKAVEKMFTDEGYKYSFDRDHNTFSTGFNLSKTKLSHVDIRILVRPTGDDPGMCSRIISYGTIGMKADASSMVQVSEFINRANYGTILGNFELDHRDGEIRYKLSCNCKDVLPGPDALDDFLSVPVFSFNRYGDGLLGVIMGMVSAEDAIKKIEG